MKNKTKISISIIAPIALLFHPTLVYVALKVPLREYVTALVINIINSSMGFLAGYLIWLARYKTAKNQDKIFLRGACGLIGYFFLFFGVPFSVIYSLITVFVTRTASAEISLGPGALGLSIAGLYLCYRKPQDKPFNEEDAPDQDPVR